MQKDNNRERTIGENEEHNPSKAMDSKKEVEQSKDPKTDQDFPGYPHYPAREDIMDQRNDYIRENVDVENLPNSKNRSGVGQRFAAGNKSERSEEASDPGRADDDLGMRPGTDADVTNDDLAALRSIDAERGQPQNISNEDLNTDLDVPGSELDDDNEALGEEDEENNYYSLGGDRHESQEEDPYSGPERDNE